jgi:hypothetical protein
MLIIVVREHDVGIAIVVLKMNAYPARMLFFNSTIGKDRQVSKEDGIRRLWWTLCLRNFFLGAVSWRWNCDEDFQVDDLGKDILFLFDNILFDWNAIFLNARIYPVGAKARHEAVILRRMGKRQ